jgi:hypothetical protein
VNWILRPKYSLQFIPVHDRDIAMKARSVKIPPDVKSHAQGNLTQIPHWVAMVLTVVLGTALRCREAAGMA